MSASFLRVDEDFEYLLTFLPAGWQEAARATGALRRCRKIPDAETLLRVLLIHLAEGCSLRETAALARKGKLIELSDVGIMGRLKSAGAWFQWMNVQLMNRWVGPPPSRVFGTKRKVRVVDATRIKEPGPTGSSWCVHYSIGLPSLGCEQLIVCDAHGNGETFKRFEVQPGDLLIGDRAYGVPPGIKYVRDRGGDVLVRFAMSNLPLVTDEGKPFPLLPHLRELRGTKVREWSVKVRGTKSEVPGRVCAIKKSRAAAERARQRVLRQAQKSGAKPKEETFEAAGYTFIFTTLGAEDLSAINALEMYRGRWQIELVFKHLKSLIGVGHLRKSDPEAATAWIHGKLFVAFLVEALIRHAESFSPWGYPLCENPPEISLSLA